MTRLLVSGFTISLDGYGAGPRQSTKEPLGVGGEELHDWLVHTRTFKGIYNKEGGDSDIDEEFAARGGSTAATSPLPHDGSTSRGDSG